MSYNPQGLVSVQLTPTLDTGAYASGDALFATTLLAGAPKSGIIRQITMVDKDDTASESATFYFFGSNVTFGTAGSAPSISDADAASILGISGAVATNIDLGGLKIGTLAVTIPYDTISGLYVAALTSAAMTHTASGISLNFVIERWL